MVRLGGACCQVWLVEPDAKHRVAGHAASRDAVLSHCGCRSRQVEFTGSLIVVPDISIATAPGERITTKFGEANSCRKTACRALLVRLSCSVQRRELAAAAASEGDALTNLCRGLKEGARAHRHGRDGDAVAGCAGADLQAVLRRLLHHGERRAVSRDDAVRSITLVPGNAPTPMRTVRDCSALPATPSEAGRLPCCRGRRHQAAWSTSGRTRS
jgi:hypothetical protein